MRDSRKAHALVLILLLKLKNKIASYTDVVIKKKKYPMLVDLQDSVNGEYCRNGRGVTYI